MNRARRAAVAITSACCLLLSGCAGAPDVSVAPSQEAPTAPPTEARPTPSAAAVQALDDPVFAAPGPGAALFDRLNDDLPLGWGSRLANLGNNGLGEIYRVLPDGTLDPAPSGWVAATWDIASAFIEGTSLDGLFDEFHVTNNTDSGIDAYVIFGERMALGVNLAAFRTPQRWFDTFVHELGHAFTADDTQLRTLADCDTFEVWEGACVIRGGRLHQWYERFWAGYGEDAPSPTSADRGFGARFRNSHPADSVSAYAAMNFFEDIAESFRVFVEEPLRDDTAGVVMWEKQMWFAQFPDMLHFRSQVREAFAGLY